MRQIHFRGWCTVASLLLLAVGAMADETGRGTVVLLSGERFTDVEYRVESALGMIVLGTGEQARRVPFAEITAVFDSTGTNITARVIGSWFNRLAADSAGKAIDRAGEKTMPPPLPIAGDSAAAIDKTGLHWDTSAYAVKSPKAKIEQTWTIGFRLSPTFSGPLYNWPKYTDAGFGNECELRVAVTRNFGFGLLASHAGPNYNDSFFILDPMAGWTVFRTISVLDVWRYFLTFQYYRYAEPSEAGGPFVYALAGAGAVSRDENLEVWAHHDSFGTGHFVFRDTSMVQFAATFGLGVTVPLVGSLALDVGVSGDVIWDHKREIMTYYPEVNYTHRSREFSTVGIYTIQVGLIYLL